MGLRSYVSQYKNQQELPEFELARKRLKSDLNESAQNQRDALERKLAQLQGGPSGAGIKLTQQLEQDISKQYERGAEDIFAQELAARRQLDEAQKQREFQTSERVGGQEFAGTQAALQRQFATQERLGSQGFQTQERLGVQGFQSQERLGAQGFQSQERVGAQEFAGSEAEKQRKLQQGQFEKELGFKQQIQKFAESSKLRELDMAKAQLDMDRQTTEFNKIQSLHATGDWRIQKAGLEALIKDPNTSAAGKSAARILYNTYGYNSGGWGPPI